METEKPEPDRSRRGQVTYFEEAKRIDEFHRSFARAATELMKEMREQFVLKKNIQRFKHGGEWVRRASDVFMALLQFMLEHYGPSIVVMSDAQAPCWAVVLSQAIELGAKEEAEQLVGLLYNSLLSAPGMVALEDLAPERVLEFLMARLSKVAEDDEILARPATIMAVLLLAAQKLGLEDAIDPGLWELDGESFSAYVTQDFAEWGSEVMCSGKYAVWHIGVDFFRVKDILETWPVSETIAPSDIGVASGLVVASLVYPDRVAWHLLRPAGEAEPVGT